MTDPTPLAPECTCGPGWKAVGHLGTQGGLPLIVGPDDCPLVQWLRRCDTYSPPPPTPLPFDPSDRVHRRALLPRTGSRQDENRTTLLEYVDRLERENDATRAELARVQAAHLTAEEWTPNDHCPWSTKHGATVYEYCRLTRGHEGDHVMDYVDSLEAERDAARAALERVERDLQEARAQAWRNAECAAAHTTEAYTLSCFIASQAEERIHADQAGRALVVDAVALCESVERVSMIERRGHGPLAKKLRTSIAATPTRWRTGEETE